jgi:hypothetical protein
MSVIFNDGREFHILLDDGFDVGNRGELILTRRQAQVLRNHLDFALNPAEESDLTLILEDG